MRALFCINLSSVRIYGCVAMVRRINGSTKRFTRAIRQQRLYNCHYQASRYVSFHKTHLGTETHNQNACCDYGNIRAVCLDLWLHQRAVLQGCQNVCRLERSVFQETDSFVLTLFHDTRLAQSSSHAKKVTAYLVYFELHICICILFICHTNKWL